MGLLTLPTEILRLIVDDKDLFQSDLISLSRACTLLDSIVSPILYRTVKISTTDIGELNPLLTGLLTSQRSRCRRLQSYVKEFECSVDVPMHVITPTDEQDADWEGLCQLTRETGGDVDDLIWPFTTENSRTIHVSLLGILLALAEDQLLSFKLTWYDTTYDSDRGYIDEAIFHALKRQKRLASLALVRNDRRDHSALVWSLPSLETLEITDTTSESKPAYIATLIQSCVSLKHVQLYLLYYNVEDHSEENREYDYLYTALQIPALQSFQLTRCLLLPSFATIVARNTLTTLSLKNCRGNTSIIEFVASRETPLTKLSMINNQYDFATCCDIVRSAPPGLVELYLVSAFVPFDEHETLLSSAIALHVTTLRFLTVHTSYHMADTDIDAIALPRDGDLTLRAYEIVSQQCPNLEELSMMGYNQRSQTLFEMPHLTLTNLKRLFLIPCSAAFAREIFRGFKGQETAFFAALDVVRHLQNIYKENKQVPLLNLVMIGDYKIGARVFYVDWNGWEPTVEECLWEPPVGRLTDWILPDPWVQAFVDAMGQAGLDNGRCMMVSHL